VNLSGAECKKTARDISKLCAKHGGGKRCIFINPESKEPCGKGARSGSLFCVRHGGDGFCKFADSKTGELCWKKTQDCAGHKKLTEVTAKSKTTDRLLLLEACAAVKLEPMASVVIHGDGSSESPILL
jgi:hypothetical protein